MRERSVVRLSVTPSTKCSCSGSPPRLAKGKTTMEVGAFGADLGLGDSWAANVTRAVGNYGESFDRNLGVHSPLAIPRGLNQLWNTGASNTPADKVSEPAGTTTGSMRFADERR